ncbi:MAG: hypothetical protein ACI9BD_000811 [Candidatus Marinamargulisbacteria bacterium]|jgi:hypothetical protein
MFFAFKIFLSAFIIAGVSELAKRVTWIAAILASVPILSILALIWLYVETKDVQRVIDLSNGIFWAVLPSLLFFVVLPLLLRQGVGFPISLSISILIMASGYGLYSYLMAVFRGVS